MLASAHAGGLAYAGKWMPVQLQTALFLQFGFTELASTILMTASWLSHAAALKTGVWKEPTDPLADERQGRVLRATVAFLVVLDLTVVAFAALYPLWASLLAPTVSVLFLAQTCGRDDRRAGNGVVWTMTDMVAAAVRECVPGAVYPPLHCTPLHRRRPFVHWIALASLLCAPCCVCLCRALPPGLSGCGRGRTYGRSAPLGTGAARCSLSARAGCCCARS